MGEEGGEGWRGELEGGEPRGGGATRAGGPERGARKGTCGGLCLGPRGRHSGPSPGQERSRAVCFPPPKSTLKDTIAPAQNRPAS